MTEEKTFTTNDIREFLQISLIRDQQQANDGLITSYDWNAPSMNNLCTIFAQAISEAVKNKRLIQIMCLDENGLVQPRTYTPLGCLKNLNHIIMSWVSKHPITNISKDDYQKQLTEKQTEHKMQIRKIEKTKQQFQQVSKRQFPSPEQFRALTKREQVAETLSDSPLENQEI